MLLKCICITTSQINRNLGMLKLLQLLTDIFAELTFVQEIYEVKMHGYLNFKKLSNLGQRKKDGSEKHIIKWKCYVTTLLEIQNCIDKPLKFREE